MLSLQRNRYQPGSVHQTANDALKEIPAYCTLGTSFLRRLPYLVLVWIAIGLGTFVPPAPASEAVVQIRVVHRDVSEMLTIVQPLISPNGYISADGASNSLIVIDHPVYVDRIRKLVSRIDQPVSQLKISVRFGRQKATQAQSTSARATIEAGNATIEAGDKKDTDKNEGSNASIEVGDKADDGVGVKMSSDKRRRQDSGEYTVIVRSGSTAYISSGSDVAYPERWSDLSRRHGYTRSNITFKKVDTGYDVRPVLMGNIVQIDITPHISYINPRGFRRPIRFAEAATRLRAPLGVWVEIGGTNTGQQEINRQILGGGRASKNDQLTMQLMVTLN